MTGKPEIILNFWSQQVPSHSGLPSVWRQHPPRTEPFAGFGGDLGPLLSSMPRRRARP